jgi:hypothetical protein
MRSLGDTYVKDEFKRHKAVTNPLQIVGFLGQWKVYLDQLEAGGVNAKGGEERAKFEGRRLKEEEFSKVSLRSRRGGTGSWSGGHADSSLSTLTIPAPTQLYSYRKSSSTSFTSS